MAQVLVRPHILSDRDQLSLLVEPGKSLQDIVDAVWDKDAQQCVVMTVNGDIVPSQYWRTTRPKDGAMVRGTLTFAGGGGSKKILGLVAMIALAVFAPWAGAAVFGAGTFGAAALSVGIMVVGSMLIGAMFKPAGMDMGSGSTDPKESQTYSISSQSNQATHYGPIPRVYGTHKMFPRIAAAPFAVTEGNHQYLYMLLDFGFGPLQIDDLRIGETPLLQYQNVQYKIHNEFVAGDPLEIYTNDTTTEVIGAALDYNVPIQRTTELLTQGIGIDIQFPRGLTKYNTKSGNREKLSVNFSIEIATKGSGVWVGYGAYPFTTSGKYVTNTSSPTTTLLAETKVSQLAAPNPMVGGGPDLRRRSYGVKKGDTTLTLAAGAYPPTVGSSLAFPDGNKYAVQRVSGNIVTISPALVNNYTFGSSSGSTLSVPYISPTGSSRLGITAASGEPVNITLTVLTPPGQYDVRVTRTTTEYTKTNYSAETAWAALRSQIARPPIAPTVPHCIMELRIRASEQLSGTIQTLSGICTSILPAWDAGVGDWVTTLTNQPASAFLDVLKGSSTARPMPDSAIDWDSLREWAIQTTELNQNGESAFTFNHIVDYNTTKYQLLNSIASAGRGTLTWRDGKIGVAMDKEKTVPAQMFTPRNSWGMNSVRTYLDAPHALRVKFVDPALDWIEGEVIVYAPGYNVDTATKFEEYKTFGVTNSDQAWRDGNYMLAQGLLRREEFTIQVDIENLACIRGDFVLVQYDTLKVGGDSSRVDTVESSTVFYQRDVIPNTGSESLGVRIRNSRTGVLSGVLTAYAESPYKWTLAAPYADIQPDDLIVWGQITKETGEYLVKQIAPGNDFTATLTLVEMAREIYSADTGVIPPYTPPSNGRPADMPPQPPGNVRVVQVNRTVNRRPYADVVLEWTLPTQGAYRKYNVYAKPQDQSGGDVSVGSTVDASLTVMYNHDIISSPYTESAIGFGVESIDFVGAASDIIWAQNTIVNPMWVPSDLAFLSSNVQGEHTVLTWRLPDISANEGDRQVVGFDIRWSADTVNPSFTYATRVAELTAWPTTTITVPTRNGTYLIKPYTSSGVYSEDAAKTMVKVEDVIRVDYWSNPRFAPGWVGNFIDTEALAGELRLKPLADGSLPPVGYFIPTYTEQYTQTIISRASAYLSAYGLSAGDLLSGPRFTPLANAIPIASQHAGDDYDTKLWVSTTDPFVAAGQPPDLTNARPFLSGQVEGDRLWFVVEVRTMDGETTPSVVQAGADIDFPERQEDHPDYPIPSGGTRLVFDYPFIMAPLVSITLQDAQTGWYVQRGQADQYGVDIAIKNSSGVGVAGTVDIQAYGAGRVIL